MDAPYVSPTGAGPIKLVHGQPVTGKAVADSAEVRARVDVREDGGLALGGYDCVSYHAPGFCLKPAVGKEDCEVFTENVLQGRVRYRFATKENADLFKSAHFAVYKPRYGGFCAAGRGRRGGERERFTWKDSPSAPKSSDTSFFLLTLISQYFIFWQRALFG